MTIFPMQREFQGMASLCVSKASHQQWKKPHCTPLGIYCRTKYIMLSVTIFQFHTSSHSWCQTQHQPTVQLWTAEKQQHMMALPCFHLYHTNSLGYFSCKLDVLCCFIKLEIWYSVLKISNDKLLILNFTSTTHRNIKRIKEWVFYIT